ncbi:hypothetical protein [Paracoccus sp. ME4]
MSRTAILVKRGGLGKALVAASLASVHPGRLDGALDTSFEEPIT